jgi:hypothetical protein
MPQAPRQELNFPPLALNPQHMHNAKTPDIAMAGTSDPCHRNDRFNLPTGPKKCASKPPLLYHNGGLQGNPILGNPLSSFPPARGDQPHRWAGWAPRMIKR